MAWLHLIRYKNILILWTNIWMVYYFLALPVLQKAGLDPRLSLFEYCVFTIVAAIIVTWGNIDNDIQDIDIDQINRPSHKRFIPDQISLATAKSSLRWLSVIGLILSISLAINNGLYLEWLAYPLSLLLLRYYNTHLSRRPFWGNILIALLSGMISIVAFYAAVPCIISCSDTIYHGYAIAISVSLLCMVASFIREIIKDLEDLSGDQAQGRLTIPAQHGIVLTHRLIAISAGILMLVTLLYMIYFKDTISIWGHIILMILVIWPMLNLIVLIFFNTFTQYKYWTRYLKLSLIAGLVHLLFLQF